VKVAVAGGTGFLGQCLARELTRRGHEVVVLTRRAGTGPASGARVCTFDPAHPDPQALAGVEAVVNLAGEPINQRWTSSTKARILASRVVTTEALVNAARESGTVRTFINASAVGYYGGHAGSSSEELDEDSPRGHDFLASVCVAWEGAALRAATLGMRTAVLRMGMVLHPEGGALLQMLGPFRLGLGGVLGAGNQYLSWIHRDDAVALVCFALEDDRVRDALNGTAPHPVTQHDFARALGRALHRPAFVRTPAFALRALLGEMATLVLTGQRVIPRRALALGFSFRYPTLEAALPQLFASSAPRGAEPSPT
jgi:uncharacterized protein (TIGR01777 family)